VLTVDVVVDAVGVAGCGDGVGCITVVVMRVGADVGGDRC